ncbi:MAG: hypothetical protein ACKVQJ_12430 [Pyrinomonadaceae bacterium]
MRNDQTALPNISFCSSLNGDAWRDLDGPKAFESWHFDAISDNGNEALVIAFYDNYALSPRFFESKQVLEKTKCPAVSFVYSVDGKVVLSSINEFAAKDFTASPGKANCSLASSSFCIEGADYGSGFFVTVDILGRGGSRIHAELEWLFIESDLMQPTGEQHAAVWNLVVPRADVSGRIMLTGRRGETKKQIKFRGTGYHDHISSENVHYRNLASRMWGRAHFVDSTIVFERHGGVQNASAAGKLFLIRDGMIQAYGANCDVSGHKRDGWGLRVPLDIVYTSQDGIRVSIKPVSKIRSGFSEVKMLSSISLDLADGRTRNATGITEFVDPRRMKNRLSRWIARFRIGRNGRPPIF